MNNNYVATTILAFFLALQSGCAKEAHTEHGTNTASIVSEQKLIYESQHDFNETLTRLTAALEKRNLNIFTEVDHQAGAEKVDLSSIKITLSSSAILKLVRCSCRKTRNSELICH